MLPMHQQMLILLQSIPMIYEENDNMSLFSFTLHCLKWSLSLWCHQGFPVLFPLQWKCFLLSDIKGSSAHK